MAQTTNHLRDLLEKIKDDAERALGLLSNENGLRSLGWKCTGCGHVKHFTRPVTAAVADRCPKCKGDSFGRSNTLRYPLSTEELGFLENRSRSVGVVTASDQLRFRRTTQGRLGDRRSRYWGQRLIWLRFT
jgi:predicted Zn-ribbon and HTH transcriptional regulator